jgi:hypothetical protein
MNKAPGGSWYVAYNTGTGLSIVGSIIHNGSWTITMGGLSWLIGSWRVATKQGFETKSRRTNSCFIHF